MPAVRQRPRSSSSRTPEPQSARHFGSLADGRYTLTALASQVSGNGLALDGNGDATPGDNSTFALFRFYGDVTGDAQVDVGDLGAFAGT